MIRTFKIFTQKFISPKNSPNESKDFICLQRRNNVSKSYAPITYRHIAQNIESSVINMESCGSHNGVTKGKLQIWNKEFWCLGVDVRTILMQLHW